MNFQPKSIPESTQERFPKLDEFLFDGSTALYEKLSCGRSAVEPDDSFYLSYVLMPDIPLYEEDDDNGGIRARDLSNMGNMLPNPYQQQAFEIFDAIADMVEVNTPELNILQIKALLEKFVLCLQDMKDSFDLYLTVDPHQMQTSMNEYLGRTGLSELQF